MWSENDRANSVSVVRANSPATQPSTRPGPCAPKSASDSGIWSVNDGQGSGMTPFNAPPAAWLNTFTGSQAQRPVADTSSATARDAARSAAQSPRQPSMCTAKSAVRSG